MLGTIFYLLYCEYSSKIKIIYALMVANSLYYFNIDKDSRMQLQMLK